MEALAAAEEAADEEAEVEPLEVDEEAPGRATGDTETSGAMLPSLSLGAAILLVLFILRPTAGVNLPLLSPELDTRLLSRSLTEDTLSFALLLPS